MLHKLMHHPWAAYLRKPGCPHWGMLILRAAVGAVFIYHGYPKLFVNMAGTVAFFDKIGIPAPGFFAPFVGVVEFFGGLALILGLAARIVGLAFVINMAVAILAAKGLSSWKGIELELLLLSGGFAVLTNGAGAYSLDAWLMKKGSKEHAAAMPMPGAPKQ